MPNAVEIQARGNLLCVRLSGKLTREFYEDFVPTVDSQIEAVGPLRVLVELQDFHGWTAGALWEDTNFSAHHWRDIKRLAIVGESQWERGMATFCKPFTAARVKYFDHSELAAAEAWVTEELRVETRNEK